MTIVKEKNIDELEEVELWREIDSVAGLLMVACCNKDVYGLVGDKYNELMLHYQQMVYQTKKFGVEFDNEEYGDNFKESKSFKFWRMYWLTHLMALGAEKYYAFQQKLIDASDIKDLLPTDNWKDEYQAKRKIKA